MNEFYRFLTGGWSTNWNSKCSFKWFWKLCLRGGKWSRRSEENIRPCCTWYYSDFEKQIFFCFSETISISFQNTRNSLISWKLIGVIQILKNMKLFLLSSGYKIYRLRLEHTDLFRNIKIHKKSISMVWTVIYMNVFIRAHNSEHSWNFTGFDKNINLQICAFYEISFCKNSFSERPRFLDVTNLSPSIIVGRPLLLDCSVTGTPKPTIIWTKVSRLRKFFHKSPHFFLLIGMTFDKI